jgi:hypothetical protein
MTWFHLALPSMSLDSFPVIFDTLADFRTDLKRLAKRLLQDTLVSFPNPIFPSFDRLVGLESLNPPQIGLWVILSFLLLTA